VPGTSTKDPWPRVRCRFSQVWPVLPTLIESLTPIPVSSPHPPIHLCPAHTVQSHDWLIPTSNPHQDIFHPSNPGNPCGSCRRHYDMHSIQQRYSTSWAIGYELTDTVVSSVYSEHINTRNRTLPQDQAEGATVSDNYIAGLDEHPQVGLK